MHLLFIAKCVAHKHNLVNSETSLKNYILSDYCIFLFPEPSAAPNVNNILISPSCGEVTWKPLPKSSLNGVLSKYILVLKKINEEEKESLITKEERFEEKFRLQNLKPFTHYSLQIAACNRVGSGPMSDHFTFRTPEKGIQN